MASETANQNLEDLEMKEKVDSQDEELQKQVQALLDENEKIGGFRKLLPYNSPKVLIFTGTFCSAIVGGSNPAAGIVLSYILGTMTKPIEDLTNEDGSLTKNAYLE